MRILFLTNNAISEPLITWLSQREDMTVVDHKLTPDDVVGHGPDLIVSYSYRHILKRAVLDTLPGRFVNLHISLLPFNRGADPNAWSYLDGTPPGVTIHEIDEGIDTGAILLQQHVAIDEASETLASSYRRLHEAIQTLFRNHWEDLRTRSIISQPQREAGTFHASADFARFREQLLGTEGWDVPLLTLRERHRRLIASS
ncbi:MULTISPECIES: formyltransferase family protein [Paraburkholderia]|uniref:Formyl transferase n=1 Tax=Paraburkholderia podalyriae TaxID=1938811 RepID=A0ABR7PG79_9BURK|nr:formyltransferase family protein [Paraburkholderia podalyriae]MBC8745370.1 formyl transferase [Paraburkholderia podalyriae]